MPATDQTDDIALLRQFATENSGDAFATLVARHIGLVHSAALRQTGNPHAAEEITQAVFIILAGKAGSLGGKVVLPGWLYQTARLTAANYLRTEIRRIRREQEAHMNSLENETLAEDATWQQIAPLLDTAMGKLNAADGNAIVLRFFENKSMDEIAAALDAPEATVRKRVTRAVERLRKFFTQRGITLTAAAIAGAVSANSVQAAPLGLAATVTATAAKGTLISATLTTLVKGTMKTMTWLKIKFAVGVGVAALVVGGAIPIIMAQTQNNPTNSTPGLAANDSTLIVPGRSVGEVRKGMTAEQVEAALGKPDRKSGKNGGIWEYTRFGFAVFTTPVGVPVVMCGDSSGADSALAKAFKARTKENIGMGSTRAEVLKAFGEPTTTEQLPPKSEVLEFKAIGLRFSLLDGKVHHIIVDFRNTK